MPGRRSSWRVDLQRLNDDLSSVRLLFADEVSALVLKALATRVRIKPSDTVDVWRCLEICLAAETDPSAFSHGTPADAAEIIRGLFTHDGPGMRMLADQQRLNKESADQRHTRIRALIARLLPPT